MGNVRGRHLALLIGGLALAGAGLNLDGERATPRGRPDAPAAELRLVLNVPAYRLDVYERGELTRSFQVAVGQPRHATPRGEYKISKVVWNPWWHPPSSKWARGEKPTAPGPHNPMGRAKLYFRNLYYIHGSPETGSMGEPASHGCVRMRNSQVIELARLVHQYSSPRVSGRELNALEANPRGTRTIWLERPVRLEIVYDLVEVRSDWLFIHRDVYGAAGGATRESVIQALTGAGAEPLALDRTRIEELVKRARRESVSVRVASVLAGEPATAAAAS